MEYDVILYLLLDGKWNYKVHAWRRPIDNIKNNIPSRVPISSRKLTGITLLAYGIFFANGKLVAESLALFRVKPSKYRAVTLKREISENFSEKKTPC